MTDNPSYLGNYVTADNLLVTCCSATAMGALELMNRRSQRCPWCQAKCIPLAEPCTVFSLIVFGSVRRIPHSHWKTIARCIANPRCISQSAIAVRAHMVVIELNGQTGSK